MKTDQSTKRTTLKVKLNEVLTIAIPQKKLDCECETSNGHQNKCVRIKIELNLNFYGRHFYPKQFTGKGSCLRTSTGGSSFHTGDLNPGLPH